MRKNIRSLVLAVALFAAGCHSSGGDEPPPDTTPPAVPAGLATTAVQAFSVALSWTATTDTGGTGVKDYRLYRDNTLLATVAGTTYIDTTVLASTNYVYSIAARDNADNESARSPNVNVTTPAASSSDTTPPSVPTGLTSTSVQTTSVALRWNAATDTGGSGLKDYVLYRNGSQRAVVTGTTYTDTTIANQNYSYTIAARDNANNQSAQSAAYSVTTPALAVFGLDSRPSNTTCVAPARTVGSGTVTITRAFNLGFTTPVAAMQAPGDSSRWFVVEKTGRIMTFNVNNPTPTVFLDIRLRIDDPDEEAGMLGLAFHPDFSSNGRYYVFYTGNSTNYQIQSRISQFTSANRTTTDPATEVVLITADKGAPNHNGGQLAFGPDRFLYASFGDGGGADDEYGNGQSTRTLFGKIIRIDVNSGTPYGIPPSNTFSGNALCPAVWAGYSASDVFRSGAACPEIYAYGLRNPWRFSFDRGSPTPDMWVGDVGQSAYEEIDHVTAPGGNFGWDVREGPQCHEPASGCTSTGLIDPSVSLSHGSGMGSVIGGFVYRGSAIPSLVGRYLFTDFYNTGLFVYDSNAAGYTTLLANTGVTASAFAEDNNGELYLVDYATGALHRLDPGATSGGSAVPSLLSQTGCVAPGNPTQPASGLVPFAPNAPFWSDGAAKERWMALPNNTSVTVDPSSGDWTFPNGTVLMKNFRLQGQLIETRLLMRHPDGEWAGYTYQWNAQQTEATRVVGGATVGLGSPSQNWIYPSEAQCLQCHTTAAGRSLGPETKQLNGELLYTATNRTANQVATLAHIGILPTMPDPATLPALPDPFGTAGTVAERARSYLHTNCSFCHRPGGGVPGTMDLRYETTMSATNTCNVDPTAGNLGVAGAKIVTPANPSASVLYLRMNRRDANKMPPVGSNVVDSAGAALLQQWISQMNGTCN